jgi:hypothetical protein
VIVQVDQSIKVEQTHKDTVVAFSDGIRYAILIPARVKREAIQRLRRSGRRGPRLYRTYSFLRCIIRSKIS